MDEWSQGGSGHLQKDHMCVLPPMPSFFLHKTKHVERPEWSVFYSKLSRISFYLLFYLIADIHVHC